MHTFILDMHTPQTQAVHCKRHTQFSAPSKWLHCGVCGVCGSAAGVRVYEWMGGCSPSCHAFLFQAITCISWQAKCAEEWANQFKVYARCKSDFCHEKACVKGRGYFHQGKGGRAL
jgi:hypothetical protein